MSVLLGALITGALCGSMFVVGVAVAWDSWNDWIVRGIALLLAVASAVLFVWLAVQL